MTELAYFIFPLVLAYGLICFYLGYTTPRAAKAKTNKEQPIEPAHTESLAARLKIIEGKDNFTRPEAPPAKPVPGL